MFEAASFTERRMSLLEALERWGVRLRVPASSPFPSGEGVSGLRKGPSPRPSPTGRGRTLSQSVTDAVGDGYGCSSPK